MNLNHASFMEYNARMLGSYKPVAFILINDAARAKAFYGGTLGLKFVSEDEYAMVFDVQGVTLRVSLVPNYTPTEHPVLGWLVPNVVATAKDLVKAGVKLERYTFVEQDELGIWHSPDGKTKIAWFKDPDGNVLSVAQQ